HAFGTLGTRLSPRLLNARDGDGNHQSDRDCGADGDPAYETATEGRAAALGAPGEAEHRLVDRSRGLSSRQCGDGRIKASPACGLGATSGATRDMSAGDELLVDGQLPVLVGR